MPGAKAILFDPQYRKRYEYFKSLQLFLRNPDSAGAGERRNNSCTLPDLKPIRTGKSDPIIFIF
jgi:hypothetical protein